jgi:hypothetical protein
MSGPKRAGNFYACLPIMSFSIRYLFHAVSQCVSQLVKKGKKNLDDL